MRFVDANVFIRYLTQDDMSKADAAKALFHRIRDGIEEAVTCEAIIAEIVYILRSRKLYSLSSSEVREKLRPLLILPGLRIVNRNVYLLALDLIAETPSLDFEDALCVAHMTRLELTEIYSFDRDFDRVDGIQRVVPDAGV